MPPSCWRKKPVTKTRKMNHHIQMCYVKIFDFLAILRSVCYESGNASAADEEKKKVIQEFVENCQNIIKHKVNRGLSNSIIIFPDVNTLINEVVLPEIDAISVYIEKWQLEDDVIGDIFKLFNELLITLNDTKDDNQEVDPSCSPAGSSNTMSDVVLNSTNNSPSEMAGISVPHEEITVANSCLNALNEVKKKTLKYVIISINNDNQLEMELTGNGNLKNFLIAVMKEKSCKFGFYLHDFQRSFANKVSKMEREFLLLWCPDDAEDRIKILYHESIEVLKKALGIVKFMQATEYSELKLEKIAEFLEC